jgi:hypothetical protein
MYTQSFSACYVFLACSFDRSTAAYVILVTEYAGQGPTVESGVEIRGTQALMTQFTGLVLTLGTHNSHPRAEAMSKSCHTMTKSFFSLQSMKSTHTELSRDRNLPGRRDMKLDDESVHVKLAYE